GAGWGGGGGVEGGGVPAWRGRARFAGGGAPADVRFAESFGSYVVITWNPALSAPGTRESRCESARTIARSFAPAQGLFVPHPYPVTPYDPDYLGHFDLAQARR